MPRTGNVVLPVNNDPHQAVGQTPYYLVINTRALLPLKAASRVVQKFPPRSPRRHATNPSSIDPISNLELIDPAPPYTCFTPPPYSIENQLMSRFPRRCHSPPLSRFSLPIIEEAYNPSPSTTQSHLLGRTCPRSIPVLAGIPVTNKHRWTTGP